MIEAICELWPMLLADVAYTPAAAMSALAGLAAHVREVFGDTPELRAALGQLESSLGVTFVRLPGRPRLPLPRPQDQNALAATLGKFVLNVFSATALKTSMPVLCEKTPSNALYFMRLRRLIPTARIVVMVRNPVAVALSHTQREWGPTDPLEAASYSAAYFRRWRLMAIEDERCLVVRQEDLVTEPERVFSHMLDHLGLRHVDTFVRQACEELRPSLDRRPRLSSRQLQAVQARLSDDLLAFGYEN
jgi:Sulfotransferase family